MNANEPAFPIPPKESDEPQYFFSGLTKRELFAIAALNGLLSDPEYDNNPDGFAKRSVELADAIIAALSNENTSTRFLSSNSK